MLLKTVIGWGDEGGVFEINLDAEAGTVSVVKASTDDESMPSVITFSSPDDMCNVGVGLIAAAARWRSFKRAD